jgi:hypothetical protein
MANELQPFVKEALEKGYKREAIRETLSAAHWPEDEIKKALDAYAEVDFPIAVPRRRPYLSAREAFLYLVLFMTLYISAIAFGTLLFQYINRWLPDPSLGYGYSYGYDYSVDTIRSATASLIITFPIFLFLSAYLKKTLLRDPEKRSSKIRKWLTYLTLFIAAAVIIGDLITLVTNLLGGDLTLRFSLKVFTVLGISGTIFGYYLLDLRGEEKES